MKKLLLILLTAAIISSPAFVSSAQAGQGKKHHAHKAHHHARHHGKHHKHA